MVVIFKLGLSILIKVIKNVVLFIFWSVSDKFNYTYFKKTLAFITKSRKDFKTKTINDNQKKIYPPLPLEQKIKYQFICNGPEN